MKIRRGLITIFGYAALAVSLVACGGGVYRPSNLKLEPAQTPAYLEHLNPTRSSFIISHVDGVSRGIGVFHRYMLAPGKHSIRLSAAFSLGANKDDPNLYAFDRSYVSPPFEVDFVAESGGGYLIDTSFNPETRMFTARVIDQTTREVVGTASAAAK